jgi:hypothetical protein
LCGIRKHPLNKFFDTFQDIKLIENTRITPIISGIKKKRICRKSPFAKPNSK